jgi:hypothetical protein
VQDLQQVTCEKLELVSHVTGLEEEVERTKLWIPCAGPAAGHVREAGAGESRDWAGGGGGEDQGGAPPHQGPAGQASAGRPFFFSSHFVRQVLTNALKESTLGETRVLRTLLS